MAGVTSHAALSMPRDHLYSCHHALHPVICHEPPSQHLFSVEGRQIKYSLTLTYTDHSKPVNPKF
ncbi:hypothetical protein E2C01_076041 [Portunus trituberculatus]|uniref:Uncharacterized protein n=1 Tax=Portunus trituberculatus TaxID=210409 RepID=A0A5B7IGT7_PORTR|nr:hypothetical protein [Portunus trituberculatus]